MLLNDDHWSYLEWFEKFFRNKSDKCKKINLLTQEPSLHSCLRTPILGEYWELAATSQDPPPPQPPDIQRIELMMAMIRGTAHSRVSRGLIAERIRWWTSHDQDELVVKMNFLFSCLASCNVLVFMLWIILHCVTRVTMGDHGGWIRAVSSVSRKYLLTSGWCWSQSWL